MADRKDTKAKEILFVEKYIGECNFNARHAARAAGYEGDDRTISVTANRLLKRERVQEYLSLRLEEEAMSKGELLMRIARQARSSMEAVLDDEGKFDYAKAKENQSLDLVKKLKINKIGPIETVIEVEMYSSHDARALLAKHYGLLVDKHEHSGPEGKPIQQKLTIEVVKTVRSDKTNEASD